ncbi:MAG: efflux RND transporter periplasmic adaptor subunit [Terrimicrobiaceae bacterium]
MSFLLRWALLPLVLLSAVSVHAQEVLTLGKIQPESVRTLMAREAGIVETVETTIGAKVAKGQILMKLDHERQLNAYLAAKLRSENQSGIEIAEGELRDKNASLNEILERFRRRQVNQNHVEQAQGQAQVARAKLTQARMMLEMTKLELALAEKLLENRFVRSPLDGTVIEITKVEGARVGAGDPVMTVANMDELATEIPVTQDSLGSLAVGASMPIRVAGSETVRQGRIVAISPLEGAKNGEHTVRVVFENMRPTVPIAALALETILPPAVRPAPPAPAKEEKPAAKKGG